jgi:hypothetical protein
MKRNLFLLIQIICVYCASYSIAAKATSTPITRNLEDATFKKALSLNKSEQFFESALLFKSLMLSFPATKRYRSDYIAVASNAQMCEEVFKYATLSYLVKAPSYVKDAVVACPDE